MGGHVSFRSEIIFFPSQAHLEPLVMGLLDEVANLKSGFWMGVDFLMLPYKSKSKSSIRSKKIEHCANYCGDCAGSLLFSSVKFSSDLYGTLGGNKIGRGE